MKNDQTGQPSLFDTRGNAYDTPEGTPLSRSATPEGILKAVFGYDRFRPLQAEIIDKVLAGQDTLAVMPTGGGKSLCYQVPALIFPGLTLVISPLIALMQDQVAQLSAAGVEALLLNSALDRDTYRANMDRVRSGLVRLLYVAPESLVTARVQELLASVRVDCITIDEAHCISEWGHDFRPEYRKIAGIRELFPSAVCLALTATATVQVRADIRRNLKLSKPAEFVASFNRPNIFLEVVKKDDGERQIREFISARPEESGIVYCFSRKQVDSLAEALSRAGVSVLPYHAGLSDEERSENQARFIRDEVRVMVATVAFGMGINKPNVRFVIHHDLPRSPEQYYQEIGRAGRDGKPAHALLLYGYGDTRKIRFFMEEKNARETEKAEIHLKAMTDYAETRACRRATLLAWFGETWAPPDAPDTDEPCCDVCDRGAAADSDLTVPAQKFLSCVLRTGERFGAAYVADVLTGSRQKRIVENGHMKISTFGIGREWPKDDWCELARSLAAAGYLHKDAEYGVLSLSAEGRGALTGRETISLPFTPSAAQAANNGAGKGSGAALKFPKKAGKAGSSPLDPGDEAGNRIFESLKAMRRGLAEAAAVPPYVIFSDRTLEELAAKKPASASELLGVYGIGEIKAERYGEFIMQAVRGADTRESAPDGL